MIQFFRINRKLMKSRWIRIVLSITVFIVLVMPLVACSSNNSYVIATDSDFAPFCFQKDGELQGIDIEIMKAISENQNIKIEFKGYSFSAAVAAVQTNQADGIIAGMSITDDRRKLYDFSAPYYESPIAVLAKNGEKTELGLEIARDKRVAVKTASEGSRYAELLKNEYNYKINYFDDSSTMYGDIEGGNSIICFEDKVVAEQNVKNKDDIKIIKVLDAGSPYGFAVLKGKRRELLEKFNEGLNNIKQNGQYEQIINKYLKLDLY